MERENGGGPYEWFLGILWELWVVWLLWVVIKPEIEWEKLLHLRVPPSPFTTLTSTSTSPKDSASSGCVE